MALNKIDLDVSTSDAPGNVTINKVDTDNKTFVHNVSDPNQLHQYASYNTLFTLSALSERELKDTRTLDGIPHDIIIKSGGIADGNLSSHNESSQNARERGRDPSNDFNKTLEQNTRMAATLGKSSRTFKRDRDLYFTDVTMNSIPGLNEKRRLTSVTQIKMTIIEPAGITLFERLRAAAANNNYLDHIDAPYLLTVEFTGFDELGKVLSAEKKKSMKRVIPIKLTQVEMAVNTGGTVYTVKSIPYNEFAYVDRYNWVKTSGSIVPTGKTLNKVVVELEQLLNQQNKDDIGQVEIPDKYEIYIDESFKSDTTKLDNSSLEQAGMLSQQFDIGGGTGQVDQGLATAAGLDNQPIEFMKINTGNSISKILEETMKSHPMFSREMFEGWKSKVAETLTVAQQNSGEDGVYQATKSQPNMYFDYFRIRSSLIPLSQFDNKRQTNAKLIKFVIEPYKVHAYSLAIPGVSTGQNFKNFVYKTYNYMFTGDNVDVLDLNIDYKYAYFQSTLKDVDASDGRQNKVEKTTSEPSGTISNAKPVYDDGLVLKSEVTITKSSGTGKTGKSFTLVDQFIDELTHPLADMVNIRMEILGDPAWLGQSQFIPANPEKVADGVSRDKDIGYWRNNLEAIWDSKRRCYNADLAEPIVMLNFKMPTDVDDKRGVYEMGTTQQAMFSGLYRVIQVEHSFDSGKYTNVLHLTRFNNQGVYISSPASEYRSMDYKGVSTILNKKQYQAFLETEGGDISDVINIGTKIQTLYAKAKSKIKGYFG